MTKWTETTEEQYWYALECLPPAYMGGGGFLLGEPYDHNAYGQPRYRGYVERPTGRFLESVAPMTVAEFKAAIKTGEFAT
jgi:hypothetical protein